MICIKTTFLPLMYISHIKNDIIIIINFVGRQDVTVNNYMRTVRTITHGQKTSTDMQSKMLLLVFQAICWNSTYSTVTTFECSHLHDSHCLSHSEEILGREEGRRIGVCGGGMCARVGVGVQVRGNGCSVIQKTMVHVELQLISLILICICN